jgi:hypothetical protein
MAKPRTLLVWPNPFAALDHEGRPHGILQFEPEGDGVRTFDDRRFVGAQLTAEILGTLPTSHPNETAQTIQRTTFVYADEPTPVRNTAYYTGAIRRGELFAADEASATEAGLGRFLDPGKALEAAREGARATWAILAHEDHDEAPPETLTAFAFGPMPEAIAARKKAASEAAKSASPEPPKAAKPALVSTSVKAGE